jgi:uncharacterized protein (TIGR02594 family)
MSAILSLDLPVGVAQNQSHGLPGGIGVEPDLDGDLPKPPSVLGRSRPLTAEEKTARAILGEVPKSADPAEVARYFLAVGDGKYGDQWKPYTHAWPVRWNPIIVTFFRATETEPQGDETSWCAAFVNWCFLNSRGSAATHSASSGSFRTFGTAILSPVPGDIVVFERTNSAEAAAGRGHVGFFVADLGNEVEVLGGNQIEGHDRSHMISSKPLAKHGSVLKLNSYRRVPSLHG